MDLDFSHDFVRKNLMGPNCLTITEELVDTMELPPGARILDLGCGMGLSSLFLAARYPDATIYAVDLWITATENFRRFNDLGFNTIIPIHSDALELPFAEDYFDALVSTDSYNFFGCEEGVIDIVAAFVKPGGSIRIAVPGLKEEIGDDMPAQLTASWTRENMDALHSVSWWESLFGLSKSIGIDSSEEMACFDSAWADWLESDNEYAVNDRKAMAAGAGELMNLIAFRGTKL
jgi:cyclopropane fatty-acyl-phospholipid synthase-like methyltransferase